MNLKRLPSFFDPELIGLLLFLLLLPFHLVIKQVLPPPWGVYWKEILLGLLLVPWLLRHLVTAIQSRQWKGWRAISALDTAVLFYLGLLILRFGLDQSGEIGSWGLYISVMYLPLVWLVPALLRRHPAWQIWLPTLLVGVGGVAALGGLAEFWLDVSLWPSAELLQRQGFPDVFIYGTHIRRVYFTFDSPTTLANTLALLLPLALILVFYPARLGIRLAAATAALLIAACIIVTFSRGIWVSVLFALGIMVLSGLLAHFKRWVLPATGGLFVLLILGWSLLQFLQPDRAVAATQRFIELSPTAYQSVPNFGPGHSLLDREALNTQAVIQTWSLFDPIIGREDTRTVLYEHPPTSGKEEISYEVLIPEGGALKFAISLSPEVWSPEKGDGATFQLYLAPSGRPDEGQAIFTRYINPKHNPSDRRWRNFVVDLSPWAGQTVNLSLIIEGGPNKDWAFDWGGWAELQLISVTSDYFERASEENVLVQHVSSTLNWSSDETNRDRLMAWNLAWDVWQTAPLWGKGLGTTGVAALRTMPEQAFVTESQILKALVELGIPGLLALLYLWGQIACTGWRAYVEAGDPVRRLLLLGLLTSLLVIFIEGWIYQNLEVKQVNAYFWVLVGILAFIKEQAHARLPSRHHHC